MEIPRKPRKRFWITCASAAVYAACAGRIAAAVTWMGPGTDWNTAANWNPSGVPNSTSTDVVFGDTGVGTVNISASVDANSITFTNSGFVYTLTSTAGQNLSSITSITMAANVASIDFVNLTATGTNASLDFPGTGNLTIANNSLFGGLLIIGSNTIIGTPGFGGVVFQGPGTTTFSGTFSLNAAFAVDGGITKNGPGSLDFSGNGSNLSGSTILNGGTLSLDFAASTSQKASSTAILLLNNGLLQLIPNAATPVTQSYASGTNFNTGQTDIKAAGSGTVTLGLATILRNAGGTADFSPSTGATTFTITANSDYTNLLLGTGTAYATVGGGTTWATISGGAIVGLPAGLYQTNFVGPGVNTDQTASGGASGMVTNSMRFNTGTVTFNLVTPGTLQSGGVLVTPSSGGATITAAPGATLTAANGEFVFHVYDANGFSVGAPLIAANGLTKTGPGLLTLSAANTGLTGPININRGGLTITNTAAVNSASALQFNDGRSINTAGGLQQFTVDLGNSATGTVSTPITLSAFSASDYGTYFSSGLSVSSTVYFTGQITSAPGLATPIRFAAADNSTNFNLTNPANSFTGNISVKVGRLGITSDGTLGNAGNTLVLETFNGAFGGMVFLNSGINVAHAVALSGIPHFTSNGADSNTISGLISGDALTVIKNGTGTLILANPSNFFTGDISVNSGTLSLGTTGGFSATHNLTVNAGATFNPGTTNTVPTFAAITLNAGTFRAAAGSFGVLTNQLVIGPTGGTLDFTGSSAFDLIFTGANPTITVNGIATWLSPSNGSLLANFTANNVSVVIPSGVILTNGIALFNTFTGPQAFVLTGGGTLFQNSDATNQINLGANLTISQGTYRVTDISTNGHGNLGTGTFTLDGGTLSYGGATATTTKSLTLTANAGAIQVEKLATALNFNGQITGPGTLVKNGIGSLILSAANDYAGGTSLQNGTLLVRNFTGSATGTGDVNLLGGTLGGFGSIAGSVVAGAAPHTIAPSALAGTATNNLSIHNLTTNLFTTLAFNLQAPATTGGADTINVSGTLTLNGGNLQINNTSTGKNSLGYYRAIHYTGSIEGAGAASIILPAVANNISYTLDTTHDSNFIDIHRGFLGDANDDGTVNFDDFLILSQHFGQGGAWSQANFLGDPTVDFNDFLVLSQHFGQSISAGSIVVSPEEIAQFQSASQSFFAANGVPEPASVALLLLSLPALRRRRRS